MAEQPKQTLATREEIQKWVLQATVWGIVGWTLNKVFLSKLNEEIDER